MTTPAEPSGWTDQDILAARPAKNHVTADRPYAYLVESEADGHGGVDQVATIFLTHAECALRCLMCDLWKNTLQGPTPPGATARQIQWALANLPHADRIKLYNSGNFFDRRALPPEDYAQIARLCDPFQRVTVENHPKLCGEAMLRFRDLLKGELEVAIGLETAHEKTLQRLNKRMNLDDFRRAAELLRREGVRLRVFLLLRPPGMTEQEGVEWAVRSAELAFDSGAGFCAIIPTRAGNGAMEQLQQQGWFAPPSLRSLEAALQQTLALPQAGLATVDLWDVERIARCDACRSQRIARLEQMNLTQHVDAQD